MSAETLDTIAALREVGGFIVFIIAPVTLAFYAFGKLVDTETSSW